MVNKSCRSILDPSSVTPEVHNKCPLHGTTYHIRLKTGADAGESKAVQYHQLFPTCCIAYTGEQCEVHLHRRQPGNNQFSHAILPVLSLRKCLKDITIHLLLGPTAITD